MINKHVAIIGAGPAGLSAAHKLVMEGARPVVFEKASVIGGIARTEIFRGYYFDVGGHRFFTKIREVERLWHSMLGNDLLKVPRTSYIYYGGRFFEYPLEFLNTLHGLGFCESLRSLASYGRAKVCPYKEESTVEKWIINRFGRRLYEAFFKHYTEKIWGIPCNRMPADWVAQRIKGLSFSTVLSNAIFKNQAVKTLIPEFLYPSKGPGMMWGRFQTDILAGGGEIKLDSEVLTCVHDSSKVTSIRYRESGRIREIDVQEVISTTPVPRLVEALDPKAPDSILEAASQLTFRALIVVVLIIDRKDVFPGQWIYVHDPGVQVGRIQNFKNWSQAMVPDPGKTSVGLEYFCSEGDALWNMNDSEMINMASDEFSSLGFAAKSRIVDAVAIRQPKAYPIYDMGYRKNLDPIRDFLGTFHNLQSVGRNGMHCYNNMDHSMYTGMLAAENILKGDHVYDPWLVNDEDYFEEEKTGHH